MHIVPSYEYVKEKVDSNKKLSPIELFIFHHCPVGVNHARTFMHDLKDMVHDIETDQY